MLRTVLRISYTPEHTSKSKGIKVYSKLWSRIEDRSTDGKTMEDVGHYKITLRLLFHSDVPSGTQVSLRSRLLT